MQDAPLLISSIIRHGEFVYADKKVLTVTPDGLEEGDVLPGRQARGAAGRGARETRREAR